MYLNKFNPNSLADKLPVVSVCCQRFSVVIEGERGNRPRIYSLEQLLTEAVSFFCKDGFFSTWQLPCTV